MLNTHNNFPFGLLFDMKNILYANETVEDVKLFFFILSAGVFSIRFHTGVY